MRADTVSRSTEPRRPLRVTAKALPEHNRRHNRSLVLQTLFHLGAMSRADLARESGLTRVTVSDLVSDLAAEGFVRELGVREGTHIGKPATLLDIDADAFAIMAIDLSAADWFTGAIVNLRGVVQDRLETPIGTATGEAAYELVVRLCETLTARASSPLLGIGVGTPGITGHDGVVREAPNLGWSQLPLASRLAERFGVPVHVGNDANTAALGVHTFRETSGASLMVVTIEHGVGAGLIIGGALVEGEQFAAGEIGHVVVDENGALCACGRRGCLEMVIAVPQLRRRLAGASAEARAGMLAEAGRSLGIALSPVISVLNLNDVVLAGPPDLIDGRLLDAAIGTIRTRTMSAVSNGLNLRIAEDGADLVLLGAAVLVLSGELGVS